MNRKTAEVREREGETNAGCGERVSKMVFVSLSFGVSLRNVQRLVKKMRRENRRITMAEGMLFRNGPELLSILRKQKGAGKRPLRRIESGEEAGKIRIHALAERLVSETPELTQERVLEYFTAYIKRGGTLDYWEWRSIPMALTAVLLARIDSMASQLQQISAEEQAMKLEEPLRVHLRSLAWANGWDVIPMMEALYRVACLYGTDTIYPRMERDTRIKYLEITAEMARRSGSSEEKVAAMALEGGKLGDRLLGEEAKDFCRRIGSPWWPNRQRRRWNLVLAVVPLFGLCCSAALTGYAIWKGGNLLEVLAAFFLGGVLFFCLLNRLAGWIQSFVLSPAFVPRMAEVAPTARDRLLVVVPIQGETPQEEERGYQALCSHYHRLGSQNVDYLLLWDVPPDDRIVTERDEEAFARALDVMEECNQKYSPCFYLAVRYREYNRREARWRCFDGRLGAVSDLNRYLLGERREGIRLLGPKLLTSPRYVMLLEPDVRMKREGYLALYNAMKHPVNQRMGYLVAEPRMAVRNTERGPRLARILSGKSMLRSAAGRDMDRMGRSLEFSGNGIYDLEKFHEATFGAIRPDTLISPRLVYPLFCKTAFLSDVTAYGGFPGRYSLWLNRLHRRMREAYLQLPYVFGRRGAHPNFAVKAKAVWDVAESLLPLAASQFFVVSTYSAGNPWLYAAVSFAPYWIPALIQGVSLLLWPFLSWRNGSGSSKGLWYGIQREGIAFILCAFETALSLDAAWRTIYGMAVHKPGTVRWITLEQAGKGNAFTLGGYFRLMWAGIAFNAILVVGALYNGRLFPALTVAILWSFAPLVAIYLDGGAKG